MSTEVVTEVIEDQGPPPSPPAETREEPAPTTGKRVLKKSASEAPVKVEPSSITPEMREMQRSADKSIRDMIEALNGVAFQAHITRKSPDEVEDPDQPGKYITTKGFLKMVDHEIDEAWLQQRFGGGTYEIVFKKPGPKGGWVYGGQTTIPIAGDPNLANLRRQKKEADAAPAAPASEAPSVVNQALNFMAKSVERAEERASNRSGPDDAMVGLLREQLSMERQAREKMADEMRAMRAEISKPQTKNPHDDVRDKMLDKLIDGDSARITALRAQYDSEIRAINEARREDEKRFYDRMERDLANIRATHERELGSLKTSQETALQAVRSSAEVQVSSAKSAFDTQMALAKSDNERLRAENVELRVELKELRAKKERTPVEMIKDMQIIKEALGVDEDDDEPKGAVAQIAEAMTNPGTWEGISSLVGRVRGPDPAAAAAQAEQPRGKRRIVKYQGKKMILESDGRTLSELPAPKVEEGKPGEPVWPQVDPIVISQMVQLMESAFEGNQEPAIVAQGARSRVPEDLLMAIRDHGVDQVMAKMAKLSSTSPLSSQRGRVWVRQLGEALVG